MDKLKLQIAAAVQAAIEESGKSELTVALESGIPRVTLRRRLQGLTPFNSDELVLLAKVTAVDVDRFLEPIRAAAA